MGVSVSTREMKFGKRKYKSGKAKNERGRERPKQVNITYISVRVGCLEAAGLREVLMGASGIT